MRRGSWVLRLSRDLLACRIIRPFCDMVEVKCEKKESDLWDLKWRRGYKGWTSFGGR